MSILAPKTKNKVFSRHTVGKLDYTFLFFILGLAFFGLIMLLSASSYESEQATKYPQAFFLRQAMTLGIALTLMMMVSRIDYRWLRKLGWILSFLALILLLLVEFSPLGITAGGSQRWINLGPLSFQPSEIVKVSVLILMADGLAKAKWNSSTVLQRLALCMSMAGLILKEPDLGTSVLVVSSCAVLWLLGGLNLFLAIFIFIGGISGITYSILHNPYQLQRFQGWLAPEKDPLNTGYNLLQAHYAIGSGGVFGVGYGSSIQKLGYLPVSYADFIFAIICEELGIIGSLAVISCFIFLLWKGIDISLKVPGNFGRFLGLGIVFSLCTQAVFNLGGVVGLLPVTGMPLPLISYGKTSLIVVGTMLGILLNLSRHKKINIPTNSAPLKNKTKTDKPKLRIAK